MVYKSFDKNPSSSNTSGDTIESRIISNQELAKELRKPIIRNCEKWKVYFFFIVNIWDAGLADKKLISKFNKGFSFCYTLLIFIVNMRGLFLKR